MAITSQDSKIAGLKVPYDFLKVGGTMEAAGVLHSLFYTSGAPGAAAVPSPGLNGASLTTYAGQLPFTNPVSGETRMALLSALSTQAGTLLLCDRLWHNSGLVVTTTTAQALTSTAWPARDNDGSVNGNNVLVGIEVSTATTNGSAVTNCTMSYTDETGASGLTATMASFPATAAAGTFVPFQLAAGDAGVRSIQSVTLGTSLVTGTIHLVAYRVVARLGLNANVENFKDFDMLAGVRLWDNTVPFLLWQPSATTAATIMGQFAVTQG